MISPFAPVNLPQLDKSEIITKEVDISDNLSQESNQDI